MKISTKMTSFVFLCVATSSFAMCTRPASAEVTSKDVMVAARALTFLESPPKGTVEIGIVRDAADQASVKDAELIKSVIDQGLSVGDLVVRARILSAGEVQGATGLAAILVTTASPAIVQDMAAGAKNRKLLTITTDPACMRANQCVMLVRSEPKIQVLANSQVAQQNGISFNQTFSMMIKEFQ